MPPHTRGVLRDKLVFVKVNPVFMYGFRTIDLAARAGFSAADLTTLGHMDATAAAAVANRLMVTGANSPKPARVTKRDATAPTTQPGSVSTFVAYDKMVAATADGWVLSEPRKGVSLKGNVAGARSVTAIATLSNGILYAFPMNAIDFASFGATLGLEAANTITTETERNKLVTGSRTKPGKAAIVDSGGTFSGYFSTAKEGDLLAAGYNIIKTELIEYPAAGGGTP